MWGGCCVSLTLGSRYWGGVLLRWGLQDRLAKHPIMILRRTRRSVLERDERNCSGEVRID